MARLIREHMDNLKDMASPELVESARSSLVRDRDELAHRVEELQRGGDAALTYDENFADSGQVAAEQGENQALAASLREQLEDVERALAKLDDDTYGKCERCGQPISEARLEAMPAARFCIDHA